MEGLLNLSPSLKLRFEHLNRLFLDSQKQQACISQETGHPPFLPLFRPFGHPIYQPLFFPPSVYQPFPVHQTPLDLSDSSDSLKLPPSRLHMIDSLNPTTEFTPASTSALDSQPPVKLGRKRKREGGSLCCPVCCATVALSELKRHVEIEKGRLFKVADASRREGRATPDDECPSSRRKNVYLRTRSNRQSRLSARVRQRQCPVCCKRMALSEQEMKDHVNSCFKRQSESNMDSDVSYEEYEWNGETRIRATSMVDSASHGFDVVKPTDETMVLDIEGDDAYGVVQYTEADCIPCASDEGQLEGYTNPLASIRCWHVYCEECWLRTLGAKKMCPQCSEITSPSDLRKIYL